MPCVQNSGRQFSTSSATQNSSNPSQLSLTLPSQSDMEPVIRNQRVIIDLIYWPITSKSRAGAIKRLLHHRFTRQTQRWDNCSRPPKLREPPDEAHFLCPI